MSERSESVDETISGFLQREDLSPEQRQDLIVLLLKKVKEQSDENALQLRELQRTGATHRNYITAGWAVLSSLALLAVWLYEKGVLVLNASSGP